MKNRLICMLAAGVLLSPVVTSSLHAGGERTNIQGMGMARTFVASSSGLDAVGINPANLAVPTEGTVTFSLIRFGVHVGSDFMNYGMYKDYFTGVETDSGRVGRYLNDADKQSILRSFPDGLGRIASELEVRPLGLSVRIGDFGTAAVTATEYVMINGMVPRDYAAFLLYGNTPGSVYDFSSTSAYAAWMREYALSFGAELPCPFFLKSFSAGAAVKLIHGLGYFGIDRFNTRLETGADGVLNGRIDVFGRLAGLESFRGTDNTGFDPFPAPAGTGFGFDLGVASDITSYMRVGLAVTDIGSVEWTRDVEEMYGVASIRMDDPLNEAQRDSIEQAVHGETRPGENFSSALPTTFRVGVAVELHRVPAFKSIFWGEWTLACDYNLGLVEGAGVARVGRFSTGMEFRPWSFLPLRTGISVGGTDAFTFALGFGLHFGVFDLDLASEHLNFLLSEESLAHGSVAMGMRIRL
jgi:hypothetical protein